MPKPGHRRGAEFGELAPPGEKAACGRIVLFRGLSWRALSTLWRAAPEPRPASAALRPPSLPFSLLSKRWASGGCVGSCVTVEGNCSFAAVSGAATKGYEWGLGITDRLLIVCS